MSVYAFLKKYFYIIMLATLIWLTYYLYHSFLSNKAHNLPKIPAIKLTYSTVPIDKTFIGITQSTASVEIRARVKGFLTEKHFIEGEGVKKDQLLFVIDPKPFAVKVAAMEANLAKRIADEAFLKVQYARMKTLVAKGDVSEAKYDEVKAQYEAAKAEVAGALANLTEAKIDLSYCYMRSPFNGLIGEKKVNVGNLVGGQENTLLATVNQLNPIYVQFSPSIADYAEMLAFAQNRPFKVWATLPENRQFVAQGKVDLIDNIANTATASILMRATIENREALLLPGLYVETKVHLGDNPQAICVPQEAIMEDQGQKTVFIVDANGIIKVAEIEVGSEYKNQAIVTKGLEVGQIVLTSALQKLQSGMKVIPQLGIT
ncbi:MAG: hypothetical protein A3F18_03240 [Legionellales bacterium RIFCSPHIGHO2_12_FULL_37_14]|nr:MAG: hypothetical protein A3F18_03240 [Legionellales bacterium RIFCSPHIGHO2_12_FULL_37_14]